MPALPNAPAAWPRIAPAVLVLATLGITSARAQEGRTSPVGTAPAGPATSPSSPISGSAIAPTSPLVPARPGARQAAPAAASRDLGGSGNPGLDQRSRKLDRQIRRGICVGC